MFTLADISLTCDQVSMFAHRDDVETFYLFFCRLYLVDFMLCKQNNGSISVCGAAKTVLLRFLCGFLRQGLVLKAEMELSALLLWPQNCIE